MKFITRLRFLAGLVMVVLTVGALVLYLQSAMSTVHTNKAELGSDTTSIGNDYPGLVTKQAVNEGDKIKKGQTLFIVTSPQLAASISSGVILPKTLPYNVVSATGDISVVANSNGVVEKINFLSGSYVPTGAILATVDSEHGSFISGHFHLTPPDYARVKKGNAMEVTFPDNTRATATVYSVALAKNGNTVDTIVKARLQNASTGQLTFPVGTPVEAGLKLVNRTWFQQTADFLQSIFSPSHS